MSSAASKGVSPCFPRCNTSATTNAKAANAKKSARNDPSHGGRRAQKLPIWWLHSVPLPNASAYAAKSAASAGRPCR